MLLCGWQFRATFLLCFLVQFTQRPKFSTSKLFWNMNSILTGDTEPITSSTTVEPDDGNDCDDYNPCTPENAAEGKFYFPHKDPTKYVQCSEHGQCYVMNCSSGLVWDAVANTCNYPAVPSSTTPAILKSTTPAIPTSTNINHSTNSSINHSSHSNINHVRSSNDVNHDWNRSNDQDRYTMIQNISPLFCSYRHIVII